MATYTFELGNDLTHQEIDDFAKSNNIDIGKVLSDTISGLLKNKKSSIDQETEFELKKIRELMGKYAHLNPHKAASSIEEMDKSVHQAFAKKWAQDERLNRSGNDESH